MSTCRQNMPINPATENHGFHEINDHVVNEALDDPTVKLNSEQVEQVQYVILITMGPEFVSVDIHKICRIQI